MTTEIRTPTGTTHPVLWMNYTAVLDTTTRVFESPSSPTPIVIYGQRPRSRAVQIVLLYDDEAESKTCVDLHAYGGISEIIEAGRDTHTMRYVTTGQITRELDPETASIWIVTIDAQEIYDA